MKNKSTVIIVIGVVIVIAVVAAVALGGKKDSSSSYMGNMSTGSNSNSSSNASSSDDNPVATDTVKIQDYAFSPAAITVKVGTKVTWTNQDSVEHNVVSDDGSSNGPNGPLLPKGESYSYTFTKAGTYEYHCQPHPYMKAKVIVTE